MLLYTLRYCPFVLSCRVREPLSCGRSYNFPFLGSLFPSGFSLRGDMAEPQDTLVFSVTIDGATLTPVILSWREGLLFLPPLGHMGPSILGDTGPCLIVITGVGVLVASLG